MRTHYTCYSLQPPPCCSGAYHAARFPPALMTPPPRCSRCCQVTRTLPRSSRPPRVRSRLPAAPHPASATPARDHRHMVSATATCIPVPGRTTTGDRHHPPRAATTNAHPTTCTTVGQGRSSGVGSTSRIPPSSAGAPDPMDHRSAAATLATMRGRTLLANTRGGTDSRADSAKGGVATGMTAIAMVAVEGGGARGVGNGHGVWASGNSTPPALSLPASTHTHARVGCTKMCRQQHDSATCNRVLAQSRSTHCAPARGPRTKLLRLIC